MRNARERILVTDGEEIAALAMVRALRAGGYRPLVAASSDAALAVASRDCDGHVVVPDSRTDPDGFFAAVVEGAVTRGADVVLPATESALMVLSERGPEAPRDLRLGAPAGSTAALATDKRRLEELATAAGFVVPATAAIRLPEEYGGPFPVVVKAARSEVSTPDGRLEHSQVALAQSAPELRRLLERVPGEEALAQEFVPGWLRTINGVVWEGEVLASAHHAAVRTWPPTCGTMSYGRTVDPDEELDAATARLMTALRWSGVFSLDVLEGDDGIARLIDINPRPYFSLALTRAAGLNVIAIWADLLLGRTPRLPRRLRTAHFRAEEHDGRALIALAHAGAPGAALRGALPRRRTAHAVLSRRDPAPARHILRLAKNTADRVRVKS